VIFFVRNFTDSFLEPGIGPNEVHLHIAVSGFIAATGLAVLFLVAYGVRRGELWAWVGSVAAPVLGLAVALPAHYPNHFDTLGHLGPIYLATVIFVAGALLALRGSSRSIEADRAGRRPPPGGPACVQADRREGSPDDASTNDPCTCV
jgi:hypothetical protein